ncbi:MAG: hypothetical protein ABIP48_08290, partial [Planctomycetota bacterium]
MENSPNEMEQNEKTFKSGHESRSSGTGRRGLARGRRRAIGILVNHLDSQFGNGSLQCSSCVRRKKGKGGKEETRNQKVHFP